MKLTTKQLRQIIKEELNEMQTGEGEHEKIAAMICTAELIHIKQGLELAEMLDFISDVEYEPPVPDPQLRVGGTGTHTWRFDARDADALFLDELKRQYKKYSDSIKSDREDWWNSPKTDFKIMFRFSQGTHGLTPHSCEISLSIKRDIKNK